jgi:hypothetical protein
MDNVILSFSQHFSKATTERPQIGALRASNHDATQTRDLIGVETGLRPARAEMKLQKISINIFQNIEKPGFDPSGIHGPNDVEYSKPVALTDRRNFAYVNRTTLDGCGPFGVRELRFSF